jgi:hypothetical protein
MSRSKTIVQRALWTTGLICMIVLSVGAHSSCGPDAVAPPGEINETPAVEATIVETVGESHSPRAASHPIEVYRTQLPEAPFDEIGSVRATVPEWRDKAGMREALVDGLKEMARQLGGDGLANLDESSSTEVTGFNTAVVGIEYYTLTAIVIRMQEPAD